MKAVVPFLLLLAATLPQLIFGHHFASTVVDTKASKAIEEPLPTAEKVLERATLAAGGYEVLGSQRTTHWISEGESGRGSKFVYEYYRAKGKFFSRFTYESGRIIERGVISDGALTDDGKRAGVAWEITDGGSVREIVGDELQEYLRRRTAVKKGESKERRFKSADCVGIEQVNDEDTYKLVIVDHDGTEVEKYYSIETGLCVRRVCNEEFGGSLKRVTRDYFDYREVGERLVSHNQTVSYNGEVWRYRTKLFESNIDIPPGIFDAPPSMQRKINKDVAAKE